MNIKDFESWCAQVDLCTNLEECQRIREELKLNQGATRSNPGLYFIADELRAREDHIRAQRRIEGISSQEPKASVSQRAVNRMFGNSAHSFLDFALRAHSEYPITPATLEKMSVEEQDRVGSILAATQVPFKKGF